MADIEDRSAELEAPPHAEGEEADDPRKPYEPPRLTKKRSVARATLFTPMGPATGMVVMG
ncbi:hypothetical protein [Polyangium jinanense]|uniref:Uncharacterized protein n=1 Tax=Polyangium jinanense TaxID=2829994 RepID=A0A9X3X9G5_9BACT|nr:hypothetical protein [Polyangium jinanense]MDC3957519.1 hypothetical protein [Polyangium jinanense]MDC3984990.1 hypothetical protein [Polyangium jinanense]